MLPLETLGELGSIPSLGVVSVQNMPIVNDGLGRGEAINEAVETMNADQFQKNNITGKV